ncbi:28304_t:CDS:2, partial [Dentiscutata erythropus]
KLVAAGFGVPEKTLQFSSSWLQKFKEHNGIRQIKLQSEAAFADNNAIASVLLLLRSKSASYSLHRIYNMDETGLFFHLEPDRTLATHHIVGRKVDRERILIALYANTDSSHKLNLLTTSKIQSMDARIIMSFKRHYRCHHVAWILQQIEAGNHAKDLKIDRHTNILPASFNADLRNLSENIYQVIDSEINDLATMIEDLHLLNPMQVEEFLSISEENIVYEVPNDNCIISELAEIFKKNDVEDFDETDK